MDQADSPFNLNRALAACNTEITCLPAELVSKLKGASSNKGDGNEAGEQMGKTSEAANEKGTSKQPSSGENDEDTIKIGMRANGIYKELGKVMEREGLSVIAICVGSASCRKSTGCLLIFVHFHTRIL